MSKTKTAQEEKPKNKKKDPVVEKPAGRVKKRSRSDIVHEEIRTLDQGIEQGYLGLAKLLSEAVHQEYWREWGYDSSDAFFDAELVNYRKARYLVAIWDKVKSLELPEAEVESLGWSRMKDIVAVVDDDNAQEWLERAKEMSCREVTDAVKVVRRKLKAGEKAGEVPTVTSMRLTMSNEEAALILDAIEEAKRLCDSQSDTVALGMICQDWSEARGTVPQRANIEDHVRYLSKVYGVEISYKVAATKKPSKKQVAADEARKVIEKVKKNKAQGEDDPDKGGKKKGKGHVDPEEEDDLLFGEDPETEGTEEDDDSLNEILGID